MYASSAFQEVPEFCVGTSHSSEGGRNPFVGLLTYWWTDQEYASEQGGKAGNSEDNNGIKRIRSEDQKIICQERNQLSWITFPMNLLHQ